jgi:hypothetical protein
MNCEKCQCYDCGNKHIVNNEIRCGEALRRCPCMDCWEGYMRHQVYECISYMHQDVIKSLHPNTTGLVETGCIIWTNAKTGERWIERDD